MRIPALIFGWILAAGGLSGQTLIPLFSGRTSTNVPTTSFDSALRPEETRLELAAGGEFQFDPWRLRILGGQKSVAGGVGWLLEEAWIMLGEGGPLSAQTGWWPDGSGPAIFRSTVPTFTAAAGTDFLATGGAAKPRAPFKAHLRGTWEEFSLEGEFAPWTNPPALPDPASPWFPLKDIPRQITIPTVTTYTRAGDIDIVLDSVNQTPAVRIQGRWSALWGEVTGGWFQGPDKQLVFPGQIILDSLDTYRFRLLAKQASVRTGWVTLEVPWEGGKFWVEQSLTQGRLRIDGSLVELFSLNIIQQKTRATDVIETVAGASYSFSLGSWGTLRAWTEGNLQREPNNFEKKAPDFAEGVEVGLHWDQARGWGSLDFLTGTPWDPSLGWVLSKITWNWMEGRALWAAAPWFWGGPASVWGQFSDRKYWALGLSWDQ